MKQKDTLEQLFDRLEGSFDIHETPAQHQKRFLEKLESGKTSRVRSINWWIPLTPVWKPLSLAASVVLLIFAGVLFQGVNAEVEGLAGVSQEMEETQTFFTSAISEELETLRSFETVETKTLIDDTLERLGVLEAEYDQLKTDLVESGNDKRVISAMIANFQNRIELLQQVIQTIEEIKTLKANQNETII